jgi:hypothetical protein
MHSGGPRWETRLEDTYIYASERDYSHSRSKYTHSNISTLQAQLVRLHVRQDVPYLLLPRLPSAPRTKLVPGLVHTHTTLALTLAQVVGDPQCASNETAFHALNEIHIDVSERSL